MSVTDEIKSRIDIVDLINDYVPLKKSGRNYKALCPFHAENTPSFVVFPESQQWRCFGACGEGGDIFSFLMKREGWDFPEALRVLAERAGVELKPATPEQAEAQEENERLRGLMEEAAQFFHRLLLQAPDASHARQYVDSRGLSADTVSEFLLGYAPHSWDATLNMLLERGYTRDDLQAAGMVVVRDDGGIYDRFRDRLVIPIRDVRGRVVGFGARALSKDAVPKYLNSPQSHIFDKSTLLYGLSHARRTIRESETAVIVEGYMDVLQAHQAGFTNVVAEMGTALTETQLRTLARYTNRLILALDPDTAGQMATDRGREVIARVSKAAAEQVAEDGMWALDVAERDYRAKVTPEFDPRGMLRYESRLGFDIRVIVLPPGQDPDDLIRDTPEAWAGLVRGAVPIVEYVIQRTIEGVNLNDPKVKSEVAQAIVPLIEDVPDAVERSHYRQRLARLLRVSEGALFPAAAGGGTPARHAPTPPPRGREARPSAPAFAESPTRRREAFCLAALIRYPRLLYQVNRILAEFLAPEQIAEVLPEGAVEGGHVPPALAWYITPADFSHPEHQEIFNVWAGALRQDEVEPEHWLLEALDDVTRPTVTDWLTMPLDAFLRHAAPVESNVSYQKIFEQVAKGLLTLRVNQLRRHIEEMTFLFLEADNGGDSLTAKAHGETIKALSVALNKLTTVADGSARVPASHTQRSSGFS